MDGQFCTEHSSLMIGGNCGRCATDSAPKLSDLEEKLGYTFKDKDLLLAALDWRVDAKFMPKAKTLELLGDKLLGLIVTEELVNLMPMDDVVLFNQIQNTLVSNKFFSEIASSLDVREYVLRYRSKKDGRTFPADVFEAVTYAIYLDAGRDLETARKFVIKHVISHIGQALENIHAPYHTNESKLLRLVWDTYKKFPNYKLLPAEKGAIATVGIYANETLLATGSGLYVSAARTIAILQALKQLEQNAAESNTSRP